MYAHIVIFKKLGEFDDELTYRIPEELLTTLKVGNLVNVPFMNRKLMGIVTGLSESPPKDFDEKKIKSLNSVVPDFKLTNQSVSVARFISGYYRTSMGRAMRLMLPKRIWNGKIDPPELTPFDVKAFNLKRSEVVLTAAQQKAVEQIDGAEKPVLLHGVTGSGKTEVYLRRILKAIQAGKQAVLLVPEIALTPQTVMYFKEYFGDHIAVIHSKLTEKKRADEWWKVKSGHAALVIGSRSAIFTPFQNLGLIILDEEHEWTYKQESAPYYQTHRVAEKMAALWKSELIFGSATPSAESYLKSEKGEYMYAHLPERIHRSDLPKIEVVDLREEFKKKNFSIFSLKLQNKIRDRLEKKEQIILFVNQRGMASAVVCRDCGYTEKCPHCEVSLKLHRNFNNLGYRTQNTGNRKPSSAGRQETGCRLQETGRGVQNIGNSRSNADSGQLMCHYCNYVKEPELLCPECRSPYIKHVGVGTQRVEQEVHRLFPEARTIRADRDTTQTGEGFAGIYREFLAGEHDVLIGTQMIAKGLDFKNVSLIGIILADIGLHIPDFRSSERLFQILTQVAGRCGRREHPGEVVLQTYNPEHPTIQKAAAYQYIDFVEKELEERKKLNYPPYNRMVKFTVVGTDPKKLADHIQLEKEVLEDIFKVHNLDVKILSAPSMIPKIADRYYYHVLLRSKDPDILFKHWKPPKYWRVDIDPIHTT